MYIIHYTKGGLFMAKKETVYPEWVQQQRTKGTTVKKVGNTYYLYKRTSKRVPGKKYPQPVDTYIGIITPDGIVERKKQQLATTSIRVKEFGFSKAVWDSCPDDWKKAVGDDWKDKLACIIMKSSPESFLSVEMELKTEDELSFSASGQAGMLSRRFYKKYGIDFSRLECLKTIYLVYIEKHVFVSEISDEQSKLLEKLSITMEYK
jgi:hypothetical protein